MVKMEVDLKEGNLYFNTNKDGKNISDNSDHNWKGTNTKSKSKKKRKVKVEIDLPNTGLGEEKQLESDIVNYKEKKSDTTTSPLITTNENDNINGKALTASKDVQIFLAFHESTNPFERQKLAKVKSKLNKIQYSEIDSKTGNLMPMGSEHVLKDKVKQKKRRKLDNVGKTGKKDVIEGINS